MIFIINYKDCQNTFYLIETSIKNITSLLVIKKGRCIMQKILFTIILLILMLGCATTEKYDNKLTNLLGQNVSVLTSEFGTPSGKKILANGDEVISFTSVNNNYVPSDFFLYKPYSLQGDTNVYTPFDQNYDFTPFAENFNQLPALTCQTSFWIRDNIIIGWKWRGNNCISQ